MNPVIIIAIIISIVVGIGFAVFFTSSIQPQSTETSEEQSDEAAWQLLQKTYLEQECRELHMGQPEELQNCFDRIDEEQRLNPPANPNEFEECSIQCLVYNPVCGEDGVTYGCGVEDAACHGVNVEYEGECSDLSAPNSEEN